MTVRAAGEPRSHVPVMALGVSRLGQSLPAVRGLTAAGDIQRALTANAQTLVDAVGGHMAAAEARRVRAQQEANRSGARKHSGSPRISRRENKKRSGHVPRRPGCAGPGER
jgi:hypothetical protein